MVIAAASTVSLFITWVQPCTHLQQQTMANRESHVSGVTKCRHRLGHSSIGSAKQTQALANTTEYPMLMPKQLMYGTMVDIDIWYEIA